MDFEIVKGVPLPKNKQGKPRKYNLPIEDMDVGDMVKVPMPKTKVATEHRVVRNFVLRYTYKNPNKKFTVRQMEDGIGVWRTK
jgi:ribosomal protein L19|tara:strand:+ start:104 stop:352 length:249 start_codon:yes stop_codon:yes gene_type:complete